MEYILIPFLVLTLQRILSDDMESEASAFLIIFLCFLESLHVFLARCATPTALFSDKKRGEGGSCLWHGGDVLICDRGADEQMLHYPLYALPGL